MTKNTSEGLAILIGAVLLLLYTLFNPGKDSAPQRHDQTGQALTECQLAIKRLARDPDTAEVPYVDNHGQPGEYYFAWGSSTQHARMRNGLGMDVPVSASCIVDGASMEITSLTLNGKTMR